MTSSLHPLWRSNCAAVGNGFVTKKQGGDLTSAKEKARFIKMMEEVKAMEGIRVMEGIIAWN